MFALSALQDSVSYGATVWAKCRERETEVRERERENVVSFLSVLLILQTESWVTECTHIHTYAPKASFAGITTADIRCCKLPFFLRSFSCCSLGFLAGYLCSSLARGFPASFCLCFGLRWKKLRPHPALLPFLSFSLSSAWEHSSLCLLLCCDY